MFHLRSEALFEGVRHESIVRGFGGELAGSICVMRCEVLNVWQVRRTPDVFYKVVRGRHWHLLSLPDRFLQKSCNHLFCTNNIC